MPHRSSLAELHAQTFPVIRELILAASPRLGRPVDRDDLGPMLKDHPETASALLSHYHSEPRHRSFDEYCRVEVDWYGANCRKLERGDLSAEEETVMRPAMRGVRRLEKSRGHKYLRYEPDASANH